MPNQSTQSSLGVKFLLKFILTGCAYNSFVDKAVLHHKSSGDPVIVFAEHFGHTYAMALTGDIWHVCFYELFRWEFESSKIQFEMARLPPIGCHFISASKRGWRFRRCHIGLQFTTVHCSQSGFISLQSLLQKSTQGKHHYPCAWYYPKTKAFLMKNLLIY